MSDFKYIIPDSEEGLPLKAIVKNHFGFSSRLMTKLKQQKLIYLNDEFLPGWVSVSAGDVITVSLPAEKSEFPPEDIPIHVVFEDDDLLVINKQPGFVVHPTKGKPCHTIANGLAKKILDEGVDYKIRFVNRLDMNTSGLLIVAKNSHAQDNLVKQMKKDHIHKKYLALVEGRLPSASGTINLPIGRPDENEVERWVLPVEKGGYPSVTHYLVIDEFTENSGNERGKYYSLLELTLETGRTHQIRVHLAYSGYPIVGDHLYCHGDPFAWRSLNGIATPPRKECFERGETPPETNPEVVSHLISRQALHAHSLSFVHPVNGKRIELKAPLPEDMKEAIEKLDKI